MMALPDGLEVRVPRTGYAQIVTRTGNVLFEIRPANVEGRVNYITLLTDIFDQITIEGYGRRLAGACGH